MPASSTLQGVQSTASVTSQGGRRRFSLSSMEVQVQNDRARIPYRTDTRGSLQQRSASAVSLEQSWPRTFRNSVTMLSGAPELEGHLLGETAPLLVEEKFLDEEEFDRPVGESTFFQTLMNTVNTMLGVGMLSLPYALRCSGWLIGGGMTVILLVITNYTGKLLRKCIDFGPGIRSFPDMGEVAFGPRGRYFISVAFYCEVYTVSAMFLILAADNLMVLFPQYHFWQFVVLTTIIVLPSASTSRLQILSYFSILGLISSIFLFAVVLYFGLTTKEHPGSLVDPMPTRILPPDFTTHMIAYGLVMVGFAGHACLPSIYESMKEPQKYDRMLDVTWAVLGSMYMAMAAMGYLMYGDLTKDEVTKNIAGSGAAATVAVWLIVVNPMTKFALTLNPCALAVEEIWAEKLPQKMQWIANLFTRWGLAASMAAVSIAVPNFARVVGFIGSVFAFTVSVLFPCACFLKLYWIELSNSEIFMNMCMMTIAFVMMVLGTAGTALSNPDAA